MRPAALRGREARDHVATLAERLDAGVLADHLATTLEREVYLGFADHPGLFDLVRAACDAKVRLLREVLAGELAFEDLEAPESVALAHALAHAGVPVETVERSYRVGQEAVWQWWLDQVDVYVARTGAPMADILRATSPVMFGFVDQMLSLTLGSYNDALDDQRRMAGDRRRRLVEQILDGTLDAPGPDAERLLRYRLEGTHVAVALEGAGSMTERAAARLHDALGGAGLLVVAARTSPRTTAWMRLAAPLDATRRATVDRVLRDARQRAALGEPGEGLAGFRATHADAQIALRVQQALGPDAAPVTWAREVRIEALGLGSEPARRLVATELEALRALAPPLRATLEAWLVTGSNVGAAARLGVHEQTVRNRLRLIEQELGGALRERRTELHVALRLDGVVRAGETAHGTRESPA